MERFMFETKDSKQLATVYQHLLDEESKEIYMARSMFSLSDERSYLKNVVRNMVASTCLLEKVKENASQSLVLFGAGTWGDAITYFFPEIKFDYVVDNRKAGSLFKGIPIISVDELKTKKKVYIVIAVLFQYKEIEQQLFNAGFSKENMLVLANTVEKNQYYDLPQLSLSDQEVFVDAGGFNGDTTLSFIQAVNQCYKKIYVLEPNKKLYQECMQRLKDVNRCEIMNKGVWNETKTLHFIEEDEGSRIVEQEDSLEQIQTISLDSCFKEEKLTFIKMDVEGAEYAALEGAKELISSQKPKLAISIYHKRTDIWDIPKLLLSYNADYKFYLRIYSFTGNDAVLYAI